MEVALLETFLNTLFSNGFSTVYRACIGTFVSTRMLVFYARPYDSAWPQGLYKKERLHVERSADQPDAGEQP